ncbi:MAG: prepilin-type N-terminal cleavage/methylation domain-containing protein [bacterium]|nr:prepilin-type N-terminal cleavage/methylation domain-containing protein [bacterium]
MKKGFTLIELLVVISIIALLSSVVLSSLNSARAKARDTKRYGDIRSLNNAIQLYILANGKAPDLQGTCGASEADQSCLAAADGSGSTGQDNWNRLAQDLQPYLNPLPIDPCGEPCNKSWRAIYQYLAPAQMTDACGSSIPTCDTIRYYIFAQVLETKDGPFGFRVGYSSN